MPERLDRAQQRTAVLGHPLLGKVVLKPAGDGTNPEGELSELGRTMLVCQRAGETQISAWRACQQAGDRKSLARARIVESA